MTTKIEQAIISYIADRTDYRLAALDRALIEDILFLPVSEEVTETDVHRYDIPVICEKTESGEGVIPVFTAVEQMLVWKPAGCKYITATGKTLIEMVDRMDNISEIAVNLGGVPRGSIPRSEFKRLLSLNYID